ncbi:MAG: DinB family protein [Chloroflexi bacterium]|nr:DinB family protein [Chloroflexota bacterium]
MKTVDFIHSALSDLTRATLAEVKDLTPEQMAWQPSPSGSPPGLAGQAGNPVNFIFWHMTRSLDNFCHRYVGKPAVWEVEKWHDRLRMDPTKQGTGTPVAEVGQMAFPSKVELLAYAERAYAGCLECVKELTEEKLNQVTNPERPTMTLGRQVHAFVLGHGWWHLGEIRYIKGLMGIPGRV